jgi:hypothetical protein
MTSNKAKNSYANMIYNPVPDAIIKSFHVEFDFSYSCGTGYCADGFGFIFGSYSFLNKTLNTYNHYETLYNTSGKTIAFQYSIYLFSTMYLTGTDGLNQLIYSTLSVSQTTASQHITIDYSTSNNVMSIAVYMEL